MNFTTFSLMTIVGSALWCGVLAWFGQTVITPEMLRDPEGLATALKAKSHLIAAAVLVLCLLYFLVMRLTALETGHVPEASGEGHTRAMGFQAMSHWRDGDATFLGILGIWFLIRDNPDAGDCRIRSINM